MAATAATMAMNEALVLPAVTVTVPGTVTFELPLDRPTLAPDDPAALDSVTVQLADPGVFTVDGEQLTADRTGGGAVSVIEVCWLWLL